MRLRVTAFPLPLETTSPNRGGPGRPDELTTTIPPLLRRFPSLRTLRKSLEFLSDSRSGSEALPTLGAARLQRRTSGTCLHAVPESVTALPAPNLGLISPLHDETKGGRGRVDTGYEVLVSYVKARMGSSKPPREEMKQVAKRRSARCGRIPAPPKPWQHLEKQPLTTGFDCGKIVYP